MSDEHLSLSIKWGAPVFTYRKNLCSIMPHSDHVNLEFFNGVELPDPHNVLEGTGKAMRHLKVDSIEELNEDVIVERLREAVSFQDSNQINK